MNLSLAEIQHNFANALNHHSSGDDCDINSDHFTSQQRIQIYRNNFIISLSEVLEATYPMVFSLVGDECFQQLARQHVLTNPLLEGDVTAYGQGFDSTITQFSTVIEAAPYLPEVARFEWSIDIAQQRFAISCSHPTHTLEQLASISEQQQPNIQLQLEPSLISFNSCYALFSLHNAIQNNDFDELEIHTPQSGMMWCNAQGEIQLSPLSEMSYQLVLDLKAGLPLEQISPDSLSQLNNLVALSSITGFDLLASE